MCDKHALLKSMCCVALALMAIGWAAAPAAARPPAGPEQDEWIVPPYVALKPNPRPPENLSIRLGRQIYRESCAGCHGPRGQGDGAFRWSLTKRPGDLTSMRVMEQADGTLHYKIMTGRHPMPGFGISIGETSAWDVVNYLRTLGPGARPAPVDTESGE
jgi:mono/diheme cytochrome c family protein